MDKGGRGVPWPHTGRELLQEKVFTNVITDLDKLKQRLIMEWAKLGHVVIATAIHQWHR